MLGTLASIYCAGTVHAVRGRPELLDLRAKVGPTRVGLVEDGMALCTSCAYELHSTVVDGW